MRTMRWASGFALGLLSLTAATSVWGATPHQASGGEAMREGAERPALPSQPTTDDGEWFFLDDELAHLPAQHVRHGELFGSLVDGYNRLILEAIDAVQARAMDGGGYLIGRTLDPPSSPIGYELTLFETALIDPPRPTSYCTGATYAAWVEAMNRLYPDGASRLSAERAEAARMQEPDGGRREDGVKLWGHWNDDGFGNHFALVQYTGMGEAVEPRRARPGDFMNISWTNGGGHAVVFLGWYRDADGGRWLRYWASQSGTNGLGDQLVSLERVRAVKVVRVTEPGRLFEFDVAASVDRRVPGDKVEWE